MANNSDNKFLAQLLVNSYQFPVESIILFSNLTLISKLNANQLLGIDSNYNSTISWNQWFTDWNRESVDFIYESFLSNALQEWH